MEAASFSEEGDEALVDVDESYVVAAFVIAEESLSLGSCDADAGVVDVDLVVVVMLDEACLICPPSGRLKMPWMTAFSTRG